VKIWVLAVCGPDRSGNPFCGFGMFINKLQFAAKRLKQIAGIVRPNLSESGSANNGYVPLKLFRFFRIRGSSSGEHVFRILVVAVV